MSIHPPPKNWFKAPEGSERLWIGVAFVWCLVLFAAMPYAHFKGKQNSTGESYAVEAVAFYERVQQFVQTNKVGEVEGIPIAEPAPGGDAYLLGQMWRWYPVLKLKEGQTYRLHISSLDLQHGFSLLPMNMNFQVLPGYDHVLTITPTEKGTFDIVCNEFCGIGHHLMVDPGLSASWKIWNTSYAMYLAVLASLVHGFTIPASIEVAQRFKGYAKGLFNWLTAAPWRDPGFSSLVLSMLIFGFIGGITSVTIGTEQINIIAHNTLRVPGHFHATVVGGTTLAFMGLTYYVVPLIFQKEFYFKKLARIQPYIFAAGIVLLSMGMSFAGSYGVPRRHYDVDFTGATLPAGFDAAAHFMLGIVGIGGIIAFLGMILYIFLTVAAVFFGTSNAGQPMAGWQPAERLQRNTEVYEERGERFEQLAHKVPGTMVLVFVLLVTFVVYYFANWKALTDVWPVR